MLQVVYEKWVSTDDQREIHFFVKGTDIYVWGYNPQFFNAKDVRVFLQKQGFKISGLRNRKADPARNAGISHNTRKGTQTSKTTSDTKKIPHKRDNEVKRQYIELGKTYY